MNTLLTGATGLLGNYIVKTRQRRGKIVGVYFGKYKMQDNETVRYYVCDVCDKNKLEHIFHRHGIDSVIHAAGEAKVDFCEKNYEVAHSTNIIGTKNIIELCKKYRSRLTYISTNAVFDGRKPPYKEEDPPNPINVYGRIKLECENLVREAFNDFLLIRPILMYGWNRSQERDNTVTWLLKKFENNEEIKLVDDIFDNPLYAPQCADCVLRLIEKSKSGIYHIAGEDTLNRYQFGLLVAEVFGYSKDLISPVKNEYFKGIAPRPGNTSYDTGKIRRELGIRPLGVKEGLLMMTKERNLVREKTAI